MTEPARAHNHLTRAAAVPLLLALLMVALVWLTGNSWFLLLAGSAFAVLGLAVTSRGRMEDLRLSSRYERRMAVGQELDYVFSLVNSGRRTTSPVSILLHSDGLSDVTAYVGPLRPGDAAAFETRRAALQRGVNVSMRVDMVSSHALGLVRGHLPRLFHQHMIIHPRLVESERGAQTWSRAEDAGGRAMSGPGTEMLGVREWRQGDDHRHIHWRSTARRGRLVVLERGETTVPALPLVLIGPAAVEGFETALSHAAGACDRVLRSGQPLAVAAWLPAGLTLAPTGSRLELLDWWSSLVDVAVPDPLDFASAAVAAFGNGEILVAGPPTTLDAWLPAAGQSCAPLRLRRLELAA